MKRALLGIAAFFISVSCCVLAGARINTTASCPVGLYWTVKAEAGKGRTVTFCPPQSPLFDEAKARGYIGPGFCPGGYGLLIKRVAAVAGDEVAFSDSEVRVNGELLVNSRRLSVDPSGRAMPQTRLCSCRLEQGQLLLMSDSNPLSFDARYFGPIDRAQIRNVIRPVLTW